MTARLGNVIYWAFSIIAVAILAFSALFAVLTWGERGQIVIAGMIAFMAALAWLFGRACRYVLAGQ
jgi:hypothetical protein